MIRWTSLVSGAAAFLVAHAVERAYWLSWFGAAHSPWFLNSGRAVAFTAGCVLVAGFLAGVAAKDQGDALVHAGNVAAGAALAMALVLFLGPGSTIFPIVLVFGTVIVVVGSFAGALLSLPFKARAGRTGRAS